MYLGLLLGASLISLGERLLTVRDGGGTEQVVNRRVIGRRRLLAVVVLPSRATTAAARVRSQRLQSHQLSDDHSSRACIAFFDKKIQDQNMCRFGIQ